MSDDNWTKTGRDEIQPDDGSLLWMMPAIVFALAIILGALVAATRLTCVA